MPCQNHLLEINSIAPIGQSCNGIDYVNKDHFLEDSLVSVMKINEKYDNKKYCPNNYCLVVSTPKLLTIHKRW